MARRVRKSQRRACVAAVAAALVLMTACAPSAPNTPSAEPTVTSVAPTPSLIPTQMPTPDQPPSPDPTPSPTSTLTEEQAAAVETVLEFFSLLTELSKDPEMDVQPLEDITTGQTQDIEIGLINQDRQDGLIQTGDDRYYVTEVGSVEQRLETLALSVEACTDSSDSDLIKETTGESILGSDRAYFVEWHIEMLYEVDRWKVGDITSESVEKCGP